MRKRGKIPSFGKVATLAPTSVKSAWQAITVRAERNPPYPITERENTAIAPSVPTPSPAVNRGKTRGTLFCKRKKAGVGRPFRSPKAFPNPTNPIASKKIPPNRKASVFSRSFRVFPKKAARAQSKVTADSTQIKSFMRKVPPQALFSTRAARVSENPQKKESKLTEKAVKSKKEIFATAFSPVKTLFRPSRREK